MLERLLGPIARRRRSVRIALDVVGRFGELHGGYLASAVALNLFTAIFPLLLLAIAILGFVNSANTDVPDKIISYLGLTGQAATAMTSALQHASETKKAASVIGLAGLAWSGLAITSAFEYVLDTTWQVKGGGLTGKLKGLLWFAGAGLLLALSIGLTAFIDQIVHGFVLNVAVALVAVAINAGLWMWTFLTLSSERVTWHAYVPGALLGAIGLEAIQQLATLLPGIFGGSSALYGSIGVALVVLGTLALVSRLVVYASVLNVVVWERNAERRGTSGTVTIDIDVPRTPGVVPLDADRSGAQLTRKTEVHKKD